MATQKIETGLIADSAVTTAKLADNSVTAAKIAAGSLDDQLKGISSSADAVAITIDSSENVGIGTSSIPSESRLSVVGGRTYLRSSDQYTLGIETSTGASGKFIGSPSSDTLSIYNPSGTAEFTLDSSGNVGIGTSSIDQHLHVEGGGQQAIKVETTANDYAIMQYKTSTSSLWQSFASPSNDYRIGISGVGDALTIDSSFKVGIGRTDPTQLLEVHKNAGGDQTVAKFSAHNYSDTGKTFIEIGTEYGDGSSRIGSFNDTGNKSVLVFDTHSATSGQFTERLRIDSSGNVLIKGTGYLDLEEGFRIRSESGQTGTLGFNRNPADGTHLGQSGLARYQINGPFSGSDYLDVQNYNSSGTYTGGFRVQEGSIRAYPQGVSIPSYSFSNDTNTGMTRPTGDTLQFVTGGSARWRINSSGHLVPENQHTYDIGGTNAEVRNIYAQGISFASNANASGMTSELLDDYEEGTWTPTAGFSLTINNTCRYTKVGGVVTVTFDITYATGTDGNYGRLGSLPFSSYDYSTGTIGFDTATNRVTMSYSAGTYLYLLNATTNAYLSLTDMSGIRVIGSCTYLTN